MKRRAKLTGAHRKKDEIYHAFEVRDKEIALLKEVVELQQGVIRALKEKLNGSLKKPKRHARKRH